jgi:HPt (histidine-containing phosphotransfer) domain-containing protein
MNTDDRAFRIAQLQARVIEVRRGYAQRVGGIMSDLAAQMAAPPDRVAELLKEVRDEAHRIHGTAGTVGLGDIGEMAAALEALLGEASVRNTTRPGDAIWIEAARLTEDIRDRLLAALQS